MPRAAPAMQFGRAPKEIVEKLAPTNSGTGKGLASRQEIDAIWSAFESAYGSREKALLASRKNSQVLLPFINQPATIKGAKQALVNIGGSAWANDVRLAAALTHTSTPRGGKRCTPCPRPHPYLHSALAFALELTIALAHPDHLQESWCAGLQSSEP